MEEKVTCEKTMKAKYSVQDIWNKKFCTNSNFVLREVCNEYVLISLGDSRVFSNSMISLNDTFASLWELFSGDLTTREVFDKIREEYEGPEDKIKEDIIHFIIESLDYDLLKER